MQAPPYRQHRPPDRAVSLIAMTARLRVSTILLALTLPACGGGEEQPPEELARTAPQPAASPRPVVVDTDLGADDIVALALLLRHPAVDVRAVIVSGTGLVHCPVGAQHVRSMLVDLEVRDRPVGCGRGDAGPDGLAFPEEWRGSSDTLYGLQLPPPAMARGEPAEAVSVLNDALASSRSKLTVIALGPWTNLEDLMKRHPKAAGRIARIHAMAGALDVTGNAPEGAEWNVRADPSAFATVLRTGVPVTLVPLDATNAVPLEPDFFERLSADPSLPGANLAWRLLDRNRFLTTSGQFLWDELAAIAFVDPTLVELERVRLEVDSAGRITRSDSGHESAVAVAADGARAKDAIVEALRSSG